MSCPYAGSAAAGMHGRGCAHRPDARPCQRVLLPCPAGLIDPEGFDDFRVVLGENSLGGSSSAHSGHGRSTGGCP